jgi:hypothetical protein
MASSAGGAIVISCRSPELDPVADGGVFSLWCPAAFPALIADRRKAGRPEARHFRGASIMTSSETRPFATPGAAMEKLLEIAGGVAADDEGRIPIGAINHAFLEAGGNAGEYGAAIHLAVADGWLEMHPSGSYVKLTKKSAS